MPELPEVETVRRGLAQVLEGARIARAEARRADLRFPLPPRFAARLTGARILGLSRRAKYLLAPLDRGETLVAHLGMSGRFTIVAPDSLDRPGAFHFAAAPDPVHTHIVLELETGARVEYNDPRRFGYMDLIAQDALDAHPWFAGLGPEPLGNVFDAAHLRAAFAHRRQNVKATLLDQRVVAGLGNIYVCEALFRAGISPRRAAGRIAPARLGLLADAIRVVLDEAIAAGGSTLRDFAQTDGALGYFQHRFRVYGREGEPCVNCGAPVARFVQTGRSTFWCPRCQR
ncbi:MAG: bifunctional DNA-formamidopyrimidine glycosylase/DNA-(apurinic or apyrimidinic site) lyase [Hyphomonadaceae bacterium]|nr:bifunctional DNA-formamidopyrimidine glycosylase/DNA-(apurinic or apyrimidinic site) lyase [Hyphomonadaceae bacterium]